MDWSDWDQKSLEDKGLVGWIRWADWPPPKKELPASAGGVYVLFRRSQSEPRFLDRSTGATHKKRDPSLGRDALTANGVPAANVVYIGKADHHRLRGRLNEYQAMGAKPTGSHWGGRLIWQLSDSRKLLVAYLVLPPTDIPRNVETKMIEGFRRRYGKPPLRTIRTSLDASGDRQRTPWPGHELSHSAAKDRRAVLADLSVLVDRSLL
ncbi:hypothetical protein [Nocardioides sp.]|uniref:hypothetical protein n=1 Tax=Nocardioides sp. TaxID=35761 RepID=UPI003D0F9A3F